MVTAWGHSRVDVGISWVAFRPSVCELVCGGVSAFPLTRADQVELIDGRYPRLVWSYAHDNASLVKGDDRQICACRARVCVNDYARPPVTIFDHRASRKNRGRVGGDSGG